MCAIVMKSMYFFIYCVLSLPAKLSAMVVSVFSETNVMHCSS